MLSAVAALGSWLPQLPAAATGVARSVSHQASSKKDCACPRCPGERQCCCEHGQSPSGSTCRASSDEPSGTAATTILPTAVGKLLLTSVPPVDPPLRWSFDADSALVERPYPYPSPPDKVPIAS